MFNVPTAMSANINPTMSHVEIAKLAEKRPDNVKRTIVNLANQGIITFTQIEETFQGVDGRNQRRITYHVNQRDSYVVMAQESPQFTGRLVDRWMELEARPQQVELPTTMLGWMELATETERARLALEVQVQEAAAKVATYDAIADASNSQTTTQVAKANGLRSAQQLNVILREYGIKRLDTDLPRAEYMDWFDVTEVALSNGTIRTTCRISGLGVVKITELLLSLQ